MRSAIQRVVLEHRRRYGSRRVTAVLRRRGMIVNRKRVARIMREDNLLAIQPRSFVVTTDSDHELEVYLNVASRMKVKGVNQLWVADITYIRLKTEFVYFAVILDAHSRKAIRRSLRDYLWRHSNKRLRSGNRHLAWCTTPTAACSTLLAIT